MTAAKRVLVVDDRPDTLGFMLLGLESAGFEVEVAANGRQALERQREHAADVVITDIFMPDTPVAEIATLLESHGIKRVPVMHDGQLVGIVSRANLVQALAGMREAAARVTPPADQAIRGRLKAELERQSWWGRAASNVIVTDGVVHYFGTFQSDDQQDAARVAAENIPGVRRVEDHRVPFRHVAGWE